MFSYRDHQQFEGILQFRGGKHVLSQMRSEYCRWWQNKQVRSEYCCWWQNVTQVKVITIVKPVSNTILLVIISAVKTEASAVLALGPMGLRANTANLESIPGPIQKQTVSNTILYIPWILRINLFKPTNLKDELV